MAAEVKHDTPKVDGWSCTSCTFINKLHLTNCELCTSRRPYSWKCTNCTAVNNHDGAMCTECKKFNPEIMSEKYMDRPKVARNLDNTWNCSKCTMLNGYSSNKCSACGNTTDQDMIIDNLADSSIGIENKYQPVDVVSKPENNYKNNFVVLFASRGAYGVLLRHDLQISRLKGETDSKKRVDSMFDALDEIAAEHMIDIVTICYTKSQLANCLEFKKKLKLLRYAFNIEKKELRWEFDVVGEKSLVTYIQNYRA